MIKRILDAKVDLIPVATEGRLIMANIAVKIATLRIVGVYACSQHKERVSFFVILEISSGLECFVDLIGEFVIVGRYRMNQVFGCLAR